MKQRNKGRGKEKEAVVTGELTLGSDQRLQEIKYNHLVGNGVEIKRSS